MPNPAFIYHERFDLTWKAHVFPTQKYRLLYERLIAEGIVGANEFLRPQPARRDELLLAHTADYIDELEHIASDPDTEDWMRFEAPLDKRVLTAVLYGTGGTIVAAQRALECGAAMNLAGGFHHAFADHGEGFCFINDVAVAARVIQRDQPGIRITFVDCDLHQGNGTARIFRNDPLVFTFSIHQQHLYPVKEKSSLDVGLDDFDGDEEYLRGLRRGLQAVLSFEPQLVFYLAGADPFERDQPGTLRVTKAGLRQRDRMVFETCRKANTAVAVTLAGGYSPDVCDVVDIHFATALELCAAFDDNFQTEGAADSSGKTGQT